MDGLYGTAMGLHKERTGQPKRHRESFGHLKLSLEDLDLLIHQWSTVCDSLTISIGDGVIADYVDDLKDLSKADLAHLVIRTSEPNVAISLRHNRAEITYADDASAGVLHSTIKYSLRPFKIKTPYYRLRVFWAWVYTMALVILGFIDYRIGSTPPKPLTPPPAGAPLPPPPPPPFPHFFIDIGLFTLMLLAAWFIYSYSKLDAQSSTRITRKKAKALEGVVIIDDEPIVDE